MNNIGIMAVPNGVGISRDINIISTLLKDNGYNVDTYNMYKVDYNKTYDYDLLIYLERINQRTFHMGKKRILIPNQEWFEPDWIQYLKFFDRVLAKTNFAKKIFEKHIKTDFISFTSEDRYIPNIKKDIHHWIHVAGKSIQKQTETIIETWDNNPGFPSLTIIQDPSFYKQRKVLKNINFIIDRYPDDVLKVMQNSFAVHVCPSETEGFGHYIMEALSTKSIVITTDAQPMNELVKKEYGVLVPYTATKPMKLSTCYKISSNDLEKSVINTIILCDKQKEIGDKARNFFLDNDSFFKRQFMESIHSVLNN